MKPVISIVTVCLNAERTIRKTITSVLRQTFHDYEYIIVDGCSKDNTVAIAKEYENLFRNSNIHFYIHVEKDTGVYDAMNKALHFCSGKYIQYMNADDTFFSDHALSDFFGHAIPDSYDVLYGDAYRTEKNRKMICHAKDIDLLPKYMTFNHQAAFIKKEVLNKYKFNTKYKIAADYDLFLRIYLHNHKFFYIPVIISNYSAEGLSNKDFYKTHLDYREIWDSNGIEDKNSFKMKLKTIYHWIKSKFRHIPVFSTIFYFIERKGNRL